MPVGMAGAGLGAISSIMSGRSAASGQASANAQNRMQSYAQMKFQEFMAKHAHRIEVKDLRAAGLNPILSGTGGHGAATPSGSSAHMENVKGAGVNSALAALSTLANATLTRAQATKTEAETELTKARTTTEGQQPANVAAGTALTHQQTATAQSTQRNIEADTLLKTVGKDVQLSEINKNNALINLFRKQGLTQDMQQKLLHVNALQADQILNRLTTDGLIHSDTSSLYRELVRPILDGMRDLKHNPSKYFEPSSAHDNDKYLYDGR